MCKFVTTNMVYLVTVKGESEMSYIGSAECPCDKIYYSIKNTITRREKANSTVQRFLCFLLELKKNRERSKAKQRISKKASACKA